MYSEVGQGNPGAMPPASAVRIRKVWTLTDTIMRILVIQRATGFFLGKQGHWVKHKYLALTFPTSTEALSFCLANKLTDLDFLLHFKASSFDLRLSEILCQPPHTAAKFGARTPA
jgi:hypothetical protein